MNKNFEDLKVLPLNIPDTQQGKSLVKPIHPHLPNMEKSVVLIVAPKGSGKGVLVNNLIFKFWGMENIDSLFYISPTIYSDKTSYFVRKHYPNTLYTEYSDALIKDIVDFQKNTPQQERGRCVLICDDCVDFSNHRNQLSKLCCMSRHNSIFPVILTQQCRSINKLIRTNASNVIIFKINSQEEFASIYEIYGALIGDKKTFKKMCSYCWSKKYNFIHLMLDENPIRVFKNFEEEITDKFGRRSYLDDDEDLTPEKPVDENNGDVSP